MFSLWQDAREGWDYHLSDDMITLMQGGKVVVKSLMGFDYLDMWLKGHLWLELFFRVKRAKYFCHYACIIEPDLNVAVVPVVETPKPCLHRDNSQVSVLVNSGELPDDPQDMGLGVRGVRKAARGAVHEKSLIRTVVRLEPLYLLNGVWFEVSGTFGKVHVIRLLDENRELDSGEFPIAFSCLERQLIGDVVKGSPEIAGNVSHHQTPCVYGGFADVSAENIARAVRVKISSDALTIRIESLPNIHIQHFQVFMRPLSFENGALKWVHRLYHPLGV